MTDFWWDVVDDNWVFLVIIAACWMFGVATFANIFITGRAHLLDKRGKEFFRYFPGLLLATATILVMVQYMVAATLAKMLIRLLAWLWQ